MAIGRFYGGVGALIYNPENKRYLLLRRSAQRDFSPGIWECVTGRVDQGEGFEEALRREVHEELGVIFQPEFFLGTTHFYRGEAIPENELLGVVFCGVVDNPAGIQTGDEHSEHRWVTASEAEALLNAPDASTAWTRKIIRRAETIRRLLPKELAQFYNQEGIELG